MEATEVKTNEDGTAAKLPVLEVMRRNLVPRGTAPLVGLRLQSATYVDKELVTAAINELEKLPLMVMLGEEVSPLQKIAIMVLRDSAYL